MKSIVNVVLYMPGNSTDRLQDNPEAYVVMYICFRIIYLHVHIQWMHVTTYRLQEVYIAVLYILRYIYVYIYTCIHIYIYIFT